MPEAAVPTVSPTIGEIILPPQVASGKNVTCECCRKPKLQCEFDEDCCGICDECLNSDPICIEMD